MSLARQVPNHGGHEGNWSVVTNPAIPRLISDETYRTYGQTLSEYSDSSIDENKWVIPFADGIRRTAVSFENLDITIEEMRLVKAYIIHTLSFCSSPATCASKIKSLGLLFLFLQENSFPVTMLSMPTINLFRLWIDKIESLSATRKNTIESDLYGFISFLREHALLRPNPIVPLCPRPTPRSTVRRAPDQYTMSLLDAYFLDFSHAIPTAYRCLYFLLRLIPSRDHEALFMLVDAFSVNEDLLEIRIPTYKETANHHAVYQSHYRFANEYPENLLLRCLQEQQVYALKCQKHIKEDRFKRRLMVSPRNPKRLVTADEFNTFLEEICEEQNISDAYGKPAKITMYSLRHANGAEMAASTEFSREEFTRAFAHNSRHSDNSYSYASMHDELHITAPYTASVRNALTSPTADNCVAQMVIPTRLKRMQRDPHSHLIGINSVCQERGCVPQFQHCVYCESFKPDPQYITEAERCCELLRQRIERCRAVGDSEELRFNEQQLATYITFIQRATPQ